MNRGRRPWLAGTRWKVAPEPPADVRTGWLHDPSGSIWAEVTIPVGLTDQADDILRWLEPV